MLKVILEITDFLGSCSRVNNEHTILATFDANLCLTG